MLVSSAGRDTASQAALKTLLRHLPDLTPIDGHSSVEPMTPVDPPVLRAAQLVEGSSLRAIRIPEEPRHFASRFGAFLDGAQRAQVVGHHRGIPVVYGTASAVIRVRSNRRLTTWGHQPPRVQRKFFLPLRHLPDLQGILARLQLPDFDFVDTSKADRSGEYPSAHPMVLLERAMRAIDDMREDLEHQLAEAWCARGESTLFIDGGISGNQRVASSESAVGVVKSHRTLFVDGEAMRIVFDLARGERSSVFRVAPRSRSSVLSWYLRVRDSRGHDAMWGLVRVEIAECDRPGERADEVSRWVVAEMSPLALPDGRWDKMAYGVRDCEEFLRAIC